MLFYLVVRNKSLLYIMCVRCLGMKHDWTDGTKKRWSRFIYLFKSIYWTMSKRQSANGTQSPMRGTPPLYIAIMFLFLPRSLNILFRNQYFMNLILMTKYTLSTEFVQVCGNNHWRISQVRLKKSNYRTLVLVRD